MKGGLKFKGKMLEGKENSDFKEELFQKLLTIAKAVITEKFKSFKRRANNGELLGNKYVKHAKNIEFLKELTNKDEILKSIFNDEMKESFDKYMHEIAYDTAYLLPKDKEYTNDDIQTFIIESRYGPKDALNLFSFKTPILYENNL